MRTPAEGDQVAALEELAASFALRAQDETEELIESFCNEAIRQWRLKDATFWQRVKFRARLLRAKASEPRADTGYGAGRFGGRPGGRV